MANPEHVQIVKQGTEAIAAWREKNPETLLDLSESDLTGAKLSGADLTSSNLSGPSLRDADLRDVNLAGADLTGANLRNADLPGANLSDADLRDANLSGADLTSADLLHADMRGTDLRYASLPFANLHNTLLGGADLAGAFVSWTIFANTDLGETKGLEQLDQDGPSTIGVDTLFKSRGKIPEAFLRRCGVPEEMIVQLPAIIGSMQPIQFYSCFISYSSDDDAFARRLHARLTAEKLRVWFAPEDMKGGEKSALQIDRAIQVYDRTLLVLSEASMNSEWVRREIERAREKEKQTGRNVLFPIALVPFDRIKAWKCLDVDSGEDLAKKVREYHIPDFSEWKQEDEFEKAFGDMMRDLRAKAEVKKS